MQIQIDENRRITGYATVGGFVDGVEIEMVPEGFEEAFQPRKYRYENGEILEDPDFVPPADNTVLLNEIGELKAELGATDYKALKYMEGWLTEEEYAPVKAQRQALRDQINELEAKLL
jgi:hypothetical protein